MLIKFVYSSRRFFIRENKKLEKRMSLLPSHKFLRFSFFHFFLSSMSPMQCNVCNLKWLKSFIYFQVELFRVLETDRNNKILIENHPIYTFYQLIINLEIFSFPTKIDSFKKHKLFSMTLFKIMRNFK